MRRKVDVGLPVTQANGALGAIKGANNGECNGKDEADSGSSAISIHLHEGVPEVMVYLSSALDLDTGGSIWHSSLSAAQYLLSNPDMVKEKSVIEIGGGCGLLGMAAALAGAKYVVITDIETQIPLLQKNIDSNRHLWADRCVMECKVHYFGDNLPTATDANGATTGFDVLIAADVGFDLELHAPLTASMRKFLAGTDSVGVALSNIPKRVVLTEEVRWKDIYEWYIGGMKTAFHEFTNEANTECTAHTTSTREENISHLRSCSVVCGADSRMCLHTRCCGCEGATESNPSDQSFELSQIIMTVFEINAS
jgi:predicted nicotinamide N-methyase